MTWLFTPPTEQTVPPTSLDEGLHPLANKLMRFFPSRTRGRTVWQLNNAGTSTAFSFAQPFPTIENTGANRDSLFPVEDPQLGKSWSNMQAVTYERVFMGGQTHVIEDADIVTALVTFLDGEDLTPGDWIVVA